MFGRSGLIGGRCNGQYPPRPGSNHSMECDAADDAGRSADAVQGPRVDPVMRPGDSSALCRAIGRHGRCCRSVGVQSTDQLGEAADIDRIVRSAE
jgi:hypothetical protein